MRRFQQIVLLFLVVGFFVFPQDALAFAASRLSALFGNPMGQQIQGGPKGTLDEAMITRNTALGLLAGNRTARNTTSAAPTTISAAHAVGLITRLMLQHVVNSGRARQLEQMRERIRAGFSDGHSKGKGIADQRNQQTGRWQSRSGQAFANLLHMAAINSHHDRQARSGSHGYRSRMLMRACRAFNMCGADASDILKTDEDYLALALARGCNGLDICDLFGGSKAKIAQIRGQLGFPMFAALDEDGKLRAIPVAAGGGGAEDCTGCGINLQKVAEGSFTAKPGDETTEAVFAGITARSPAMLGPDIPPTGVGSKDEYNKKLASYEPVTPVGRLMKKALFTPEHQTDGKNGLLHLVDDAESQVDRRLAGVQASIAWANTAGMATACVHKAIQISQPSPADQNANQAMQECGYQRRNSGSAYSANEMRDLRACMEKKGWAGSDTENAGEAGSYTRINNGAQSRDRADSQQSARGQPTCGSLTNGGSNGAGMSASNLPFFSDPRVVKLLKEPRFVEKVVAFRTVLPEIFLAENKEYDEYLYASLKEDFGEKYAIYAAKRQEQHDEYLLSLNNSLKHFGIDTAMYVPNVLKDSEPFLYDKVAADARAGTPWFIDESGYGRGPTFIAQAMEMSSGNLIAMNANDADSQKQLLKTASKQ